MCTTNTEAVEMCTKKEKNSIQSGKLMVHKKREESHKKGVCKAVNVIGDRNHG